MKKASTLIENLVSLTSYLVFLIILIVIASTILSTMVGTQDSLPNIDDMEIEGVGLLYQDNEVTEPS